MFLSVIGRYVFLSASQELKPAPDLSELNAYVYDEPKELVQFILTDEKGEPATRDSLRGHWTFAFVGYTNCPDVCPAAMANLRLADQLLPTDLPQPDYLFVSADPEHDTPEKLRDYTGFFGPNFHGLTGDLNIIRALARSLNAAFTHRQVDGELMVDHSSHFALLDPEGRLLAVMQPPHHPEKIAKAFERIYEWAKENRLRTES
jgi:protein SCO1/2